MLVKLQRALESPGDPAKLQIRDVWGRAWEPTFPPRSQVMPRVSLERSADTLGLGSRDFTEKKGTQRGP